MPFSTCEALNERSEIPQSVGAITKGKFQNCMTHMSQTVQILAEINSENVIDYCQRRKLLPTKMMCKCHQLMKLQGLSR
ncbi:hypothetical protein SprV_0100131200 [Sparganum proliferum]